MRPVSLQWHRGEPGVARLSAEARFLQPSGLHLQHTALSLQHAATVRLCCAAGKCRQFPGLNEMLEAAEMPQLPSLLKLSKARLDFAGRRGAGEEETCITISRHPVSPFL